MEYSHKSSSFNVLCFQVLCLTFRNCFGEHCRRVMLDNNAMLYGKFLGGHTKVLVSMAMSVFSCPWRSETVLVNTAGVSCSITEWSMLYGQFLVGQSALMLCCMASPVRVVRKPVEYNVPMKDRCAGCRCRAWEWQPSLLIVWLELYDSLATVTLSRCPTIITIVSCCVLCHQQHSPIRSDCRKCAVSPTASNQIWLQEICYATCKIQSDLTAGDVLCHLWHPIRSDCRIFVMSPAKSNQISLQICCTTSDIQSDLTADLLCHLRHPIRSHCRFVVPPATSNQISLQEICCATCDIQSDINADLLCHQWHLIKSDCRRSAVPSKSDITAGNVQYHLQHPIRSDCRRCGVPPATSTEISLQEICYATCNL